MSVLSTLADSLTRAVQHLSDMSTPDYIEHRLEEWADAIQEEIDLNEVSPYGPDEPFAHFDGTRHSEDVVSELFETLKLTRQCYVRLRHARKLLEGDHSDKSYLSRVKEDLGKLERDGYRRKQVEE